MKMNLLALVALVTFSCNLLAEKAADTVLALEGYDAVSYRDDVGPVRGSADFMSVHNDVTYHFSTETNKKLFEETPERFVPAFGGLCSYSLARGKKHRGDPEVWQVVDDRLYLNISTKIETVWLEDIPGYIEAAEENWANFEES